MSQNKVKIVKLRVRKDLYTPKRKYDNTKELNKAIAAAKARQERVIPNFCKICIKYFESENHLNHHLNLVHRPLTIYITFGVYCDKCTNILEEENYDSHKCRVKRDMTRLFMAKTNKKIKGMHSIQQIYVKTKCRICHLQFKSKIEIIHHLQANHSPTTTINVITDIKTTFCEDCQTHFEENLFDDHFPCKAVDVRCFFCLTIMPTKQHFLEHNLSWVSLRSFQCNVCNDNTKAMSSEELNYHMKKHNKRGVYKCVRCTIWLEKSTLIKHLDSYHHGCRCLSEICHCDKYNFNYYISKILLDENVEETSASQARNNTPETPASIASLPSTTTDQTNEVETINSVKKPTHVYSNTKLNVSSEIDKSQKTTNSQSSEIPAIIFAQSENEQEQSEEDNSTTKINSLSKTSSDFLDITVDLSDEDELSGSESSTSINNTYLCTECIVCGMEFLDRLSVLEHATMFHRPWALQIMGDIFCPWCNSWFNDEDEYKVHSPCRKVAVKRQCHICNMEAPFFEHFLLHNIVFLSSSRMRCTLCENNNTEYNLSTLNKHRKKEHKKKGVYECLKCEVTFVNFIELKRHLVDCKTNVDSETFAKKFQLKINKDKPPKYSKCHICDKIYFSDFILKRHIQSHSKERKYLCSICGLAFKNSSLYNQHQNCAHFKNITYDCKLCVKKFYSKKYLLQHVKIHTETKNFNCEVCSKVFVQQTSLIYHMATHTQENVFKCTVCDRMFSRQRMVTSHMEDHNKNGTNPHKCIVCNKFFSHKCKLLVHMRVHPKNNTD